MDRVERRASRVVCRQLNPVTTDETDQPRRIDAGFPPKLIQPLLVAANRYIVIHGGRGGGKSWAVARAILLKCVSRPLRVLCVREFMSSISQSVHKLLCDQIVALGLDDHFIIEKALIRGINGSEISFAGIRNNIQGLKSYEGTHLTWAEESANISKHSWEVLIPTIFRRVNSQLIVTFNAELATDDTYQRFVVNPPPEALVVKINADENPYFPPFLKAEAEFMQANDPESYHNIWLGFPRIFQENAVYGKELRQAIEENRITKVAYDPLVPVHCFFDLGWRDLTCIILCQMVANEFRIIDYIQGSQTTMPEYVRLLQQKPYVYGTHYLPPDSRATSLGTGRSIEEIMRGLGCKVQIVPRLKVNDGINATKVMFQKMWIDEIKCQELIQALRRYAWDMQVEIDGDGKRKVTTNRTPEPVHDIWSHACDALRYMAVTLREAVPAFKAKKLEVIPRECGWMS